MPPDANEAADQGVGAAFSLDEYRRRRTPSTGGRPPAGGEPPVDLERRVAALEEALERIGGKLDKIIEAQAAARLAVEQRFAAVAETGAIRFGAIDTRLADISGRSIRRLPPPMLLASKEGSMPFPQLGSSSRWCLEFLAAPF